MTAPDEPNQPGPSGSPQGPRTLEIGPDAAGQRIDNFLLTRLKGAPKSLIYRILRRGEVRVNRGRIKPSYRLQAGDSVRIPPVRLGEPRTPARPNQRVLDELEAAILYEDKRLLVLNKPSGLAVHGGSGVSFGVIEALRALRPEAHYLELVHRLDRETSGCLVIAKKRSALRALHALLRGEGEEGVDKRYLALVKGRWEGGPRRVEAPLHKNVLKSGERIVVVDPAGKAALSLFKPLTIYDDASLVEVRLITGRTHQVRVHAAHAGHPIAGDDKYGDPEFNRRMAGLGLKRLFLHARSLGFELEGGAPVQVNAPLDDDLNRVLDALERSK